MKIFILLIAISTQSLANQTELKALLELPEIDVAHELTKSTPISTKGQPLQYAISTPIKNVFIAQEKSTGGQWGQLSDGSWIWRLEVHAKNALSLDFGFYDFYLPPTAQLSFYNASGDLAKGPFTESKNKSHKQLWPGTIIGDTVTIELEVSNPYKKYVSMSLQNIARGFKSFWQDVEILPKMGQQKFWSDSDEIAIKSGSCNVDVVCDEADDWRDQIRSVGRYTIVRNGSGFLCTGQMINNTANDGRPLFLTADHCGFNDTTDASINVWWNYQSNQCRTPGSASSGNVIPISSFNDTQSGSTFLASYEPSDMALLELDDLPNPNHQVFYTGWDRQDIAPVSATGIHHPAGHAKRISFENNQTDFATNGSSVLTHIRVPDWDLGTTEGGSSGSGLWNPQNLLVGQLTGGGAACGNDESDFYGRLNISWDGGGSADSRLKDWLDPINTGVQTLQGLGECSAISVNLTHTSGSETTGEVQNFSANVSGGVAPYSYAWDVNADGAIDGTESNITATYAKKFVDNVSVAITDSEGCTSGASKAVVIESPQINLFSLTSPNPPPVQLCGNNNAFIDPGERWQVPVSLMNSGFADAQNAYAVFNKTSGSSDFIPVASDEFGNSVGNCERTFIDISTTGTELTIVDSNPNDAFPAQDEGAAAVNLSQPFDLYGRSISSLYLSTNGFISTNPSESGFDFDNDCPIPALPNNSGNGSTTSARIIPMHSDLITQHIYHQHFATCPRESGSAQAQSCDVFMYSDVDLFDQSNSTVEHFNFEAILYPEINLWVYQYDGTGFNPAASTIGIQNDNATDGVAFACNTADSINTQEAVCIYHKDNQAQASTDTTTFHLETPVLSLGNLAVSEQRSGMIEFSVDENASCGMPIGINLQAAVYNAGFDQNNSSVISTVLGNNGSCSVVSNCAPNSDNDIQPTNGLWYNPRRSGNGNDMYFQDGPDNDNEVDNLTYLQYTALPDRSPIWYITSPVSMQNNQAENNVLKVSYDGPFLTSNQSVEIVGNSTTTLIDANNAIQTRTINGEFSADLMNAFIFSNDSTPLQRTGLWYNPPQSGWGQTIGTQGDVEVVVNYLYDNIGQPYWVLGAGINSDVNNIDMQYSDTFCPHCPVVPIITNPTPVGSVRINYDGTNQSGTLEEMNINVSNSKHESQWDRSNLPLTILTAPIDN